MQIVTSSFFTRLPPQFARIGIARRAPKADYDLPAVRELSPGPWFRTATVDEYADLYVTQLAALDPRAIVRKIEDLAGGRTAALLCWERPRDGVFCHRGFVAWWLKEELSLDVYEVGLEHEGPGPFHPKLPDGYRLTLEPTLL
ncbi:hypothetical protein LHFGNBLO_004449 [Mesorhizobium sp. AR10]|uniref:hypothetical protein n=1 Tax=Mesorhizobium sp. AR10 TaxID=2865839 RepID=UPI00215F9359|nr:hypothetical protein [Mesorhizobium sp. AR10]UVK37413.1 hypothetical protein LHFGNBLO_004449 [Mesorhizobium sp. AR10]